MGYKKQKEFAEYINIKSNRYSKMENNVQQPTLEQVILISRKLNIPIEEIVYWED